MTGNQLIMTLKIRSAAELLDIRRIVAALAMHHELGVVVLGLWTTLIAVKAFLTAGKQAAWHALGWDAKNTGRTLT